MTKKKKSGARIPSKRLKTARGRKTSSTRWLQRQLNDPYVARAQAEGYRSRAAFKLLELNEKCKFLKKGARVVDLGAAPGSWSQVAIEQGCEVIGIDLQEIEPLEGATFIQGDFLDDDVLAELDVLTGDKVDVVLSDMAAPATGHQQTDHLRIMGLLEVAVDFAIHYLSPGGTFVGKVFQGGTEQELLKTLKQHFKTVKHIKPAASRKGSAEMYVVALGFKG